MTKQCAKCREIKDLTEFCFKDKKNNKRNSYCKICSRAMLRNHYQNNKQYYLDKAIARKIKLKKEAIGFLKEYFKTHPCIDCGEKRPIVLEFDHVRGEKKHSISQMIGLYSLNAIKEEIKKCDVRCANCHRIKTAKDGGWDNLYATIA